MFLISEREKGLFSQAGVEFTEVTRGPRGESLSFDIGEDDPRWQRVLEIIAAMEGRDGMPKKLRVQNFSMAAPTMKQNLQQMTERVAANVRSRPGPKWLNGYSNQTVEQLLSLEGKYRIDSLVVAFEEGIKQKVQREGLQSVTEEERVVLAVEALEREVNSGGYGQFFLNSSREFAPTIVGALQRTGCKKTATITQRAIRALGTANVTLEAIDAAIAGIDEQRLAKLNRCNDSYHKTAEPIADRLFAFIKANQSSIGF